MNEEKEFLLEQQLPHVQQQNATHIHTFKDINPMENGHGIYIFFCCCCWSLVLYPFLGFILVMVWFTATNNNFVHFFSVEKKKFFFILIDLLCVCVCLACACVYIYMGNN